MAYLRLQDYYNKRIQSAQLTQITQGRDAVRLSCELEAEAEMKSYLVQKYDVVEEYRDTKVYSYGATYKANNLFYLDATTYSATSTYALHSLTLHDSNVYICTTAIVTPEVWNIAHWTLIGAQYDLWYVDMPYYYYSYKQTYYIGDRVYYKDKVYTCLIQNTNIVPTDIDRGLSVWGSGVSYSFSGVEPYNTASDYSTWSNVTTYTTGQKVNYNSQIYYAVQGSTNVLPTSNASYWLPITWVNNDNRSQQLVPLMIDIVLYKIHMLIAPNNIPQLRVDAYNNAIQWLLEAGGQNNAITADIPLLQPKQGGRIRWGSNTRNINTY